jgi:hypothetical protein
VKVQSNLLTGIGLLVDNPDLPLDLRPGKSQPNPLIKANVKNSRTIRYVAYITNYVLVFKSKNKLFCFINLGKTVVSTFKFNPIVYCRWKGNFCMTLTYAFAV